MEVVEDRVDRVDSSVLKLKTKTDGLDSRQAKLYICITIEISQYKEPNYFILPSPYKPKNRFKR